MKAYRMEKCGHGTAMVEDQFNGEWVPVADANKMIDVLTKAFNELCALQKLYADCLGIPYRMNHAAIEIDDLLSKIE